MYRVGFPGWKMAARAGVPLFVRVDVYHDIEVDRYWASSPDLRGLVMEAQSLDELFAATRAAAQDLLELQLGSQAGQPEPQYRIMQAPALAA
jgi:predicted RNase H-like HicB family nuclease